MLVTSSKDRYETKTYTSGDTIIVTQQIGWPKTTIDEARDYRRSILIALKKGPEPIIAASWKDHRNMLIKNLGYIENKIHEYEKLNAN